MRCKRQTAPTLPATPGKEPPGVATRGASATRKAPTSCPPHPAKSRREWLIGCRREQPPHARPTTPPAGKSTRQPPRGATCGASANSPHLARHTRYTATGSALCRVERSLSPNARQTPQGASGSAYARCKRQEHPNPPPHDSGLPVVRWQTYARGFTRCKRHKTASPTALCGYSPAESLSKCRREQPPMPAPRLRPPGKAPGDLREGLRAVQAPTAPTLPGTPGIQPPGVPSRSSYRTEKPRPNARHTRKRASGSGYSDATCTEKQQHVSGGLSPLHLDKEPSR